MNYGISTAARNYATSMKRTYGAIGNVAVGLVGASVGMEALVVSTSIAPISPFTIVGGLKLNLATPGFDSADVAVSIGPGKAALYVGYLIGNGTST